MKTSHLEAVLFSAAKPLSIDVLMDVFALSKEEVEIYIDTLASELIEAERGIRAYVFPQQELNL